MLPNPERFVNRFADFIVHELTHYRQRVLIQRGGIVQNRGAHRDVGWFQAIAEAAPRYHVFGERLAKAKTTARPAHRG